MATGIPQTPQKPLPGAFLNTPALIKQSANPNTLQNSIFSRSNTASSQPNTQNATQQPQPSLFAQGSASDASAPSQSRGLTLIERAARTINATLDEEARYPALDNYVPQGHSYEYEIPSSTAWAPFQKIKMHDIPDRIFEQYNQAQVSTMMGLFADINHAWISIDNSLYLWDYTHPNPELLGFEEQPHSITAVALVKPRAGVFVGSISKLLVVATTSDIYLIGVACENTAAGGYTVSLYQTRMQVSVRGISVQCIAGSAKTGRIFFAGRSDNDVFELTYQQEEKWFQNRCAKINHTGKNYASVVPSFLYGTSKTPESVAQLVVDDTRDLIYALSSKSGIRGFNIRGPNNFDTTIDTSFNAILADVSHRNGPTALITPATPIVSICPVSTNEANRLNLIGITTTGCRIFFSAVPRTFFGYGAGDTSNSRTSMQVHHVRFPPKEQTAAPPSQQPPSNQLSLTGPPPAESLKSLTNTRLADRFPPGYFFDFVQKTPQATVDILFISAPDSGKIARPQDPSQANRIHEVGQWVQLGSRAEGIGEATRPFAAAINPTGFGNELAVQFDEPVTEVAILTNSGIHTFKRRRLVDIFASAIRYGGGDEGLEGEIRKFVRMYGRGETIATALAVACGQAADVTSDSRISKVTEPEILEYARKTFIEHGGKPLLNENSVLDQGAPAIDNVRPSPRHEGLALYISRLLRSVWKAPIAVESTTPQGALVVSPALPLTKLQDIQRDLTRLQEFFNANRTFIEGLAGPEALGRVSTKQDEVALQGEHRALNSLLTLISDVIEGIAFVLVLFDEKVAEIIQSIPDTARQQVRQMNYERLFSTRDGKDLAKELVKAIVERNIRAGSNVDTVTDALRRRCGSFCSADDCVIFKAQEQLKRASDTTSSSEFSRNLLNESLKLLEKVATSLTMEQLRYAINQYISMEFYAGAIQLALTVAQEGDRGNRALAWINEGMPPSDPRAASYEHRTRCYDLIHSVISALDRSASQAPEIVDGQYTSTARRKREAYEVVNSSKDEVFQFNIYDWYLAEGWNDRLLEIESPFVINYLQRKSLEGIAKADLLWRYYAKYNSFLDAARVQLELAKSVFELSLEQRIEYLSRARANASTRVNSVSDYGRSRQSRQELIRDISDHLDLANIQGDILQRIRSDERIPDTRRQEVVKKLNGQILPLDELYNGYADQASYFDICLYIYEAADYRNPADIRATWQHLIDQVHQQTVEAGEPIPFEKISDTVRSIGRRLALSENTFPIPIVLPMLERYSFQNQRNVGPPTWVIDTFLELSVPYEQLVPVLEAMFYNDEAPFQGKHRRYIATDLLHAIQRWAADSLSGSGAEGTGKLMGGEENAVGVSQTLQMLLSQAGMFDDAQTEVASELRTHIERSLRR